MPSAQETPAASGPAAGAASRVLLDFLGGLGSSDELTAERVATGLGWPLSPIPDRPGQWHGVHELGAGLSVAVHLYPDVLDPAQRRMSVSVGARADADAAACAAPLTDYAAALEASGFSALRRSGSARLPEPHVYTRGPVVIEIDAYRMPTPAFDGPLCVRRLIVR